jgi:hypothetical protein
MKTHRRWLLLFLLGVLIDLADPSLPGIFSLLNGDLFMDGVMRVQGGSADAKCVRDCPRVPTAAEPLHAVVAPARPPAVRDARRAFPHPVARRSADTTTAESLGDTEDH